MKSSLPILAVLAVMAAGGAEQQTGQGGGANRAEVANEEQVRQPYADAASNHRDDAGNDSRGGIAPPTLQKPTLVLHSAIAAIEKHDSIAARLRFRIDLMGQRLSGAGSYVQGPWRQRLLRMEANLQVGDKLCSLQQVCDGRRLWVRRQLLDAPSLTSIDVAQVLGKLDESATTHGAPASLTDLGLGGLPRLLRSLDDAFEFDHVASGTRSSLPVLVLRGGWKPAMLARMLPDQAEAINAGQPADLTRLYPQSPDQVLVYLGRDDLFPYCIEYVRTPESIPRKKDAALVGQPRTILMLELFEVRTNGRIDPLQFIFNPGKLTPVDGTDAYLQSMRKTAP